GEFVVTRGGGTNAWTRPPGDLGNGTGNDPVTSQTIRCESNERATVRCNAAVNHRAELIRQLSDAPCNEGGSWGWDSNGVWVNSGCRGEFRVW
ncbi:MAG: DUF3011 domain-containing protein, partial [Xanthomonadaceae bacterium]|nr:DUF3011 domain-containing protein [Xanthomonadaceae bacterium]